MASKLNLRELTPLHWQVIRLIRNSYDTEGGCPSVYQVCRKSQQIINYLRERFSEQKAIPTVFQAGEDNHLDLEELELLFPACYHRGAVKLSGLRER